MTSYTRIILTNEAKDIIRQYTISHRMVWFLGFLGLLLAGMLLWVLLIFGGLVKRAGDIPSMEKELQAARMNLTQLAQLQAELSELRGLQKKVLFLLGVEPHEPRDMAPALIGSLDDSIGGNLNSARAMILEDTMTTPSPDDVLRALAALVMATPPDTWPAAGHITKEFNVGDIARGQRPHLGLDIAGPEGTPILAAADGVVARTGKDPFLGFFIEIQHGLGYLTVYGHCRSVAVPRGEHVRRGQVVAYMGATGQATAPHVHFEIWHNGVAVDPKKYLSGEPPPP